LVGLVSVMNQNSITNQTPSSLVGSVNLRQVNFSWKKDMPSPERLKKSLSRQSILTGEANVTHYFLYNFEASTPSNVIFTGLMSPAESNSITSIQVCLEFPSVSVKGLR
jgi:hypothetical protein